MTYEPTYTFTARNRWRERLGAAWAFTFGFNRWTKESDLTPLHRHYEAAERIITMEGLTFALAVSAGKEGDLAQARALLKRAICEALAAEFERVREKTLAGDID